MASPWLEKKQRMCSSGPCERRFDLRQTGRFNKSARAIIHSNCLLPVLSGGGLKFLVTSFECSFAYVALPRRRMLNTARERFDRRRPRYFSRRIFPISLIDAHHYSMASLRARAYAPACGKFCRSLRLLKPA
jgi:hypothetical protein